MTVPLRRAAPGDVDAVTALEVEVFGPEAWSRAQVVEELTGPGRSAWVVGDRAGDDRLAGYAVTGSAGGLVDLHRIAVRPDRRGRGLARALLQAAVRAGGDAGAEAMLLEVAVGNTDALRLYAAAGFEPVDRRRRYYRDGSDALVMRLPLTVSTTGAGG